MSTHNQIYFVHWKGCGSLDFYTGLERPAGWPERSQLVEILVFVLMDNHYHLVLKEIREGGATKFMENLEPA